MAILLQNIIFPLSVDYCVSMSFLTVLLLYENIPLTGLSYNCDLFTIPLLLWRLPFILVFKLKFVQQGYKIIN